MAPTTTQKRTKDLVPVTERAFAFAIRVVKLCKYLERHSMVSKTIINQLVRAATSVGANLEEAVAGQSSADFIHKNAIALKEARESNYWLRLIMATEEFQTSIDTGVRELVQESSEISKIIGKRIVTAKAKLKKPQELAEDK